MLPIPTLPNTPTASVVLDGKITLIGEVALDQKPTVPPEVVISPVQSNPPVTPLMVHPVDPEPPAIFTIEAESTKLKVEEVEVISPPFTAKSPVKAVFPATPNVPPMLADPVVFIPAKDAADVTDRD